MANYTNCFSIAVRQDPEEVFLTFYQNHPVTSESGEIMNERAVITELVLSSDLSKELSAQLGKVVSGGEEDG